MFAITSRVLSAVALASSALLLTACGGGGGGGGNDSPQAATVEIVKTGNGTGVVSGSGLSCGSSCTANSTVGATISVTATPDAGQQFDGWAGDAAACGATQTCSFAVASTRSIARAAFSTVPTTAVSVVLSGSGMGGVTSSPAGISCTNAAGSDCSETYPRSGTVTLTATPANASNLFSGWSGDAASCGTRSSCTLALTNATVNAVATFAPAPTTAVSVVLAGNSMGTVVSNPAGINCTGTTGSDCSETYARGGMVTLTAAPANANNSFMGWSGDAAGCGSSLRCTLMLSSAALNAVATFQPINRTLSVTTSGSGTVTSDPAGINCGTACTSSYQQGTMVRLTATPAAGSSFQGFGGSCSGTAICTLTMDADKAVSATFVTTNVTLTVNKLGNGTVSSAPAGIDCGSTCSANFARNSSVTLTAVAGATDTFQGWSGGGCSGTGTCTPALNPPNGESVTVTASFAAMPGQTVGEFIGLTSGNRVVTFNRATPGTFRTSAAITGLNAGETVVAIDSRPLDGAVYGLTSRARLVTIDPVSGAASVKSTLTRDSTDTTAPTFSTLDGTRFGIDFNPTVDRLRIVSDSGQNLRVNVDTGTVIADSALNPGTPAVVDPAYSFNFVGSSATQLFVIDAASDKLFVQTPPNDGTLVEVGSLGVDASGLGGFEIIGTNVDAFAALNINGGAASGSFYAIDLRNGAASKVGDFAGNEAVISLAAPIAAAPPAAGDLALLTAGGKVITVNRAAPATQRTSAVITGLTAGDVPLDIDYRSDATRALYLLARNGTAASLYTVDPSTGAAGGRIALTADAADTTAPYAALTGSNVSIDFNPVVDRLRVVSDGGENLRVNVADGKVTTDTAIPAANAVLGAAYTNAFLQTATTTLYTIDGSSGSLKTQTPPNDGTQVGVGALSFTPVAAPIGFDIDGRNNQGLLSRTDNGTATLYVIDLASGATVGTGTALPGGEAVKGIALKTQNEPQVFGVTSTGNLIRFTSTTSAAYTTVAAVSGLPSGVSVLGMDFRPLTGQLIALGSDAKLYVINPATAAATVLSTLAPSSADTDGNTPFAASMISTANSYALDFNPVVDRLRIVSSNNTAAMAANLRVNVDTGDTITDVPVARPPVAITGIGFNNAATPVLYALDTETDRLFTVNTGTAAATAGRLTQVGSLGIDFGDVNGFDIIGASTAYAVSAGTLYELSLSSGAATSRGGIALPAGAAAVLGFSASTQGTNDLYAITDNGRLLVFDRTTPGMLITNRALSGIGAGETIIGMDFSPAGVLYVTSVSGNTVGRLYTVNLATGVATQVSYTSGTVQMTTVNSFVLPQAASYGIDFRPGSETTAAPPNTPATDGVVRIIANQANRTQANLEVNVTTLAVTSLTALNQPAPVITSEAYTSAFAGAASTRLLALDTGNDALMTQGKATPNDGQLFDLRALGVALDAPGGFDILGGADGYVVGVLKQTANAYSTLYRINLNDPATAVLTSLGDVGRPAAGTTASTLVQVNAAAIRFTP